ncbi:MAG TPA: PEP-CTERM sorting domain-containing protein [Candidatus Brocadiia bacterium]|nr:PEP-CTERM sorting domain-containing protein [Candidatus Brocadiia bacterium]
MRKVILGIACVAWSVSLAVYGDYAQPPDANAWVVGPVNSLFMAGGPVPADDWLASQSGPVTNVTVWYSFAMNISEPITSVTLEMWDGLAAAESPTGYAMPDQLVWSQSFLPGEFSTSWAGLGGGWHDPYMPYTDSSDLTYRRMDIPIDPGAEFVATAGETYWFRALMYQPAMGGGPLGWKGSVGSPNAAAVWDANGGIGVPDWQELLDPYTSAPMSLAFELSVVPEPSSVLLVIAGAAGIALFRRRLLKL